MQTFIHCRVTLHVSGVTAPIIRALKTVTATFGIGHNTGTAASFQRGLIRTGVTGYTSSDQTTLEGRKCTSIMTYTRGSGYSF